MTADDSLHPDLAGLVPPRGLERWERIAAAANRAETAARVPAGITYPLRHLLGMLSRILWDAAAAHQAAADGMCPAERKDLPCPAGMVADILLGNEVPR